MKMKIKIGKVMFRPDHGWVTAVWDYDSKGTLRAVNNYGWTQGQMFENFHFYHAWLAMTGR